MVIKFVCSRCDNEFLVPQMVPSQLSCPNCGGQVITPVPEIILSKITRDPMYAMVKPETSLEEYFNANVRMKIMIPYYGGNRLVDRAVRSWIIPEVVWILTDEGIIPPGWGVCHQLFTPKNTLTEKLHPKKTKPFLIDSLKRMVEMFPDEEYYGFFNSDIILPPGISVSHLVPNKGKCIAFYHRMEVMEVKKGDPIREFIKQGQQCCGKDGFVADKKTIKFIIENMPEMVIGAPAWDDGLVLWCWKNFGRDKVELRYGDIQHVVHPNNWSIYEKDAQFNVDQIETSGIPRQDMYQMNWARVEDEELRMHPPKKKEVLGIVQPGRIGDVIIVLPIAKWFCDMGYEVIWPVCTEFLPLFDYVNYVKALDIHGSIPGSYDKSLSLLKVAKADRVVDLGIGFGRDEKGWISSKLHFNEWKYKEAGVPTKERFNLQINRNFKKELILWESEKARYNLNGNGYSVIHDTETKGPKKFKEDGVRIYPREGFTVFDWIGVIEKADYLYCVDSCIANLADQLRLCEGRRAVWFWKAIPDVEPRKTLGFPKLCKDWKVIE
jgi:hypothetical protein